MRLRRKSGNTTAPVEPADGLDPADEPAEGAAVEESPAPSGPVDIDDLDPDATYIDLGSLLVNPAAGLELRLQVD
jgi:hypothetical protein